MVNPRFPTAPKEDDPTKPAPQGLCSA